jgi:lysophospholipase L1-like esterase
MRLTFPLLAFISLICSPLLYFQSKKVRKEVPDLPEASNPKGLIQYEGKAKFNLLVIGESTMAGVGIKDHQDGFACHLGNQISEHLHQTVSWEVQAKSGYTAKQIHDLLLPKIEMKQADLIVIGTGANDAFSLNTPNHFAKEVDKIISQLRRSYSLCPIVFISMPPVSYFPAFTKLMQFCIGNWVKFNGTKLESILKDGQQIYFMKDDIKPEDWFDKYDHFNNIHDMFSDGVHPSKMTYQLWAKECFDYMVTQGQF